MFRKISTFFRSKKNKRPPTTDRVEPRNTGNNNIDCINEIQTIKDSLVLWFSLLESIETKIFEKYSTYQELLGDSYNDYTSNKPENEEPTPEDLLKFFEDLYGDTQTFKQVLSSARIKITDTIESLRSSSNLTAGGRRKATRRRSKYKHAIF